ncbi:MAG TPA: molecular chaperone DnaK [Pyrinomonadaceae bacterium]|nr:molecular chaperone DnaK [Pyrinomonadaceae bacterium]
MGKIIGIDLGTTNCCVSVLEGGAVQIVPNKEGGRTTPSVVGFTDKGERLVGQIAKRQAVTNAANTVYAVKRLIGRKFDSSEAKRMRGAVPFEVVNSSNGDAHVRVQEKIYSPPELAGILLQRLKAAAEDFLGEAITDAIITVPAYFDDTQRQATKDAGKIAGLQVQRIINEPTAAALAYGLGKSESEKIAVYDLGGGTFDISILELNEGVFEVLSTSGNTFLGGEDFDESIMNWMADQFMQDTGIDLRKDRLALQRLKEAAERAKCELSSATESSFNLPFIAADATGPKHLNKTITRTEFEKLVTDLVDQTLEPCERALRDANLQASDIDKVILVGGQTRSPIVERTVEKIFGKKPSAEINPDEVVAMGAAIQGGVLSGDVKDIVLLDVLPLSLGLETRGGLFTKIIERNSTIPLRNGLNFTTVVDNQSSVEIHVLQGERDVASGNRSLGKFELVGIPPAPRGVPQIEVSFEVDANGIVSVSAVDKATGREQQMRITPTSGLAAEQIEKIIKEAETMAESDRSESERIALRNKLATLVKNTQRTFLEFGGLLESDQQESGQRVLSDGEAAAKADEVGEIRMAIDAVERLGRQLTNAMMKGAEATQKAD